MNVVQDNRVRIIRLELGSFGTNCYIVVCQITGRSMVVDVPGEADKILKQLNGTDPEYIVITHSHFDHIGALDELRDRLKIPVAIHSTGFKNLSFRPDINLCDGDCLKVGQLSVKVLHTPGHTQDSICLLIDKYLISGDTIFPGGPGKTSTPVEFEQILNSLQFKILILPEDTEVYPGHGESTILGKEKKEFAVFSSSMHDINLSGDVHWLNS